MVSFCLINVIERKLTNVKSEIVRFDDFVQIGLIDIFNYPNKTKMVWQVKFHSYSNTIEIMSCKSYQEACVHVRPNQPDWHPRFF